MLSIMYFSRWRHERIRSFHKLSADTVLRAHNKNMRFIHQNVLLCWVKTGTASFKSKVWKDFGFKVLYDAHGVRNVVKEIVVCGHCFSELWYISYIVSWHLYQDMYRILRKCIVAALVWPPCSAISLLCVHVHAHKQYPWPWRPWEKQLMGSYKYGALLVATNLLYYREI